MALWWLYFENAAAPAGQALARIPGPDRTRTGGIAYSLTHFLLVAGIIYRALGIAQVVTHLAHHPPSHPVGTQLDWTMTVALFGGTALHLIGRVLFLRLTVRHTPPAQLIAVGAILVLPPLARILTALGALAVLTAALVVLVCYERIKWQPTAAAR